MSGDIAATIGSPVRHLLTNCAQDTVYSIRRCGAERQRWRTLLRARLKRTRAAPPNMEVTISGDVDR
jgi:hypothetical protein